MMMKRLTIALVSIALLAWSIPSKAAMGLSDVRQNARFLSDRMVYELNLNQVQYADVYEINYDFLSNIRFLMDDVVRGSAYAIDRYYEFLDMRNEDLSYVLSRSQYMRFADKDYFYRPVYTNSSNWLLRINLVYTNPLQFFFSIPANFYTYSGNHSRVHYHTGYYCDRYHHDRYRGPLYRIRERDRFSDYCVHDFRVKPHYDNHRVSRYDAPRQTPTFHVGNRHSNGNGRYENGNRSNNRVVESRPIQSNNRPVQIGNSVRDNNRPSQVTNRPSQGNSRPSQVVNRPSQSNSRPSYSGSNGTNNQRGNSGRYSSQQQSSSTRSSQVGVPSSRVENGNKAAKERDNDRGRGNNHKSRR